MLDYLRGLRKVVIFLIAIVAFSVDIWILQLKDAATIIAVGSMITALMSAAVYGNIKVHQAGDESETEASK